MTDSNFNFITPVEILHNVHSLSPAQEREARKRRQKLPEHHPQQPEADEEPKNEDPQEEPPVRNDGPHKIDYCA